MVLGTNMSYHSVFQIINTTNAGTEAGSGWFCEEANKLAEQRYPGITSQCRYAVTNAHVVNGAIPNGLYMRHGVARKQDIPISIVGICQEADLALVKISGDAKLFLESQLKEKAGIETGIPSLEMVDSDVCMPAQYDASDPSCAVFSVGYPLGCEFQNVTKGVVQAWKKPRRRLGETWRRPGVPGMLN